MMKLYLQKYALWLLTCSMIFVLLGCADGSISTSKEITAFSFPSNNGPVNGLINAQDKTIDVTMPYGTNVTKLIATFTTSGVGVTLSGESQVSGTTANNFINPVAYVVTAADGSTATYMVTVIVALSSAKAIINFSFPSNNGPVNGLINTQHKTIDVTMPYGTNVTSLVATFTTSGIGVRVGVESQTSDSTANNFTNPVEYVVTAADGSTASYTVTVTLALSSSKAITAFSLLNAGNGLINEQDKTIGITMPYGTNVTSLVATFTTSGTSVRVGIESQTSGSTINNFTNPVAYVVTAADGSIATYTVTVTIANVYVVPVFHLPNSGYGVNMIVDNQGPFLSEIDTGSTNLMVPGNSTVCPSCGIAGVSPNISKLGESFTVEYGSGRTLTASAYPTSVRPSIGASSLPFITQTMGLITQIEGSRPDPSPILGMAQPVTPMPYGLTTYMQSLVNSGYTSDLGFMLILCPDQLAGSEMVLGGIDQRLKASPPLSVPLVQSEDHYIVNISEVGIEGGTPTKLSTPPNTILDTGNPAISLPSDAFNSLLTSIKAQAKQNNVILPDDFWFGAPTELSNAQLSLLPTITITMTNGVTLSIPAEFYIPKSITNPNLRVFKIGAYRTIAIGLPGLTAYYTYFNRSTQTVTFYQSTGLCHT